MTIQCPLTLKVHFLELAGLVPVSCFLTAPTVIPQFRKLSFPCEEHSSSGKLVPEDSNSLRSRFLMEHKLHISLKLVTSQRVQRFPIVLSD